MQTIIEIYGLSDHLKKEQLGRVKDAIREVMAHLEMIDDTVINTLESWTEQCSDGSSAPFVHVISMNDPTCQTIREVLEKTLEKRGLGNIGVQSLVARHSFGK